MVYSINDWANAIMKINNLLILALLTGLGIGCSCFKAQPKNFDECILENMKGVTSDFVAARIILSCKNLFPETYHKN